MRLFVIVGACILSIVAVAAAQSPTLASQQPITANFVDTKVSDALAFLAKYGRFTVQFDEKVPASVRDARLTPSPLSLVDVPLPEALRSIASRNGLEVVVVDPTTVVIRMREQ
jgi:type II secretory pathway component HofQ